jgi:polyisoprenyl-phosphate glycosyltransferase
MNEPILKTALSRGRDLISIVSPVYNERDNLGELHRAISEVVKTADFDIEFVLVDDGSRDDSEDVLRQLAAADPRVRVLVFSRNFGALAACNAGLRAARGDAVILMSADLQDPPSLIPRFVAEWRNGSDIVWGVRETRQDPFLKTLFARIFYGVIRIFVFPDYPKLGMDCGLFSQRVLTVYNLVPERDCNPFFSIFSLGFRQAQIPYARRARMHGCSNWTFWRRVKNCIDIVTTFSYLPLRLISATGIAFSGFALAYGTLIVIRRIFFGLGGEGWTSLAVLILLIGGLLALFIGIIAEYVWRIGEHTRQRPRYIIARRYDKLTAEQGKQETFDVLHIDVSRVEPGITNDLQRIDAQADKTTFPGVVHSLRPKSN